MKIISPRGRKDRLLRLLLFTLVLAGVDARDEYPVVPWEDLWEELDDIILGHEFCDAENSHCSRNDSSVIRTTSKPLNRVDMNVPCHCDDDCVRYGDCCRDKAEADWGDGREEGSSRYTCRKMETMGAIGLLMVESCSPGYEDKKIESLCQQQVPPAAYTYMLDLPVTSIDTNITYVNIHCAACNYDAANLHSWNVSINCNTQQILKDYTMAEFMAEAKYFGGMRQWHRYTYKSAEDKAAKVHRNQYYCTLEVGEFKNKTEFIQNYGGRLCIFPKHTCEESHKKTSPACREQVRHCNPSWPDHLDRDKCQRYSYIVTYKNEEGQKTIYKNPHCARCNFVNASSSDFKCFSPEDKRAINRVRQRNFKLPPVFSVLMDFRSKECTDENIMWDPIHMKCQKIFCGYLYVLVDGQCVRDETSFKALKNLSVIYDSCPKIPLSHYFPREDGSVFVNTTKKAYETGTYEILNNSHVLICNEDYHYISKFSAVHVYLTIAVMVISIVFLALHMIIYMLVPRFRNLPGKNLFSLACCLFIAHVLYLTGMRQTQNYGLCVSISAALHYFWMASFCWMNVMSVDVCRTFTSQVYRGNLNSRKTYICYSIYAWGIPALVIGLSFIFDFVDIAAAYRPEYGTNYCWINNLYGVLLFFLLPVGAIVLENVVLYFVTLCCILKQAKAASYASTRSQSVKEAHAAEGDRKMKHGQKQNSNVKSALQTNRLKKDRIRLMLYAKLGIIQGLSWILGFLAAFFNIPTLWYPFTFFNGLQGFFIFAAFDLKRKVGESVWESITGKPWKKNQSSKTTTHTSSLPTSTFNQSRSSKSSSDSDGENQLDISVSHLVVGDDSTMTFDDVAWSGITKNSHIKISRKPMPQPSRSQKESSTQLNDTNTTGHITGNDSRNGTGSRVRNGDLRNTIVKGSFDDERSKDYAALSRARADAENKGNSQINKRRKSDLQRVIDLLMQQLQQSKNSSDLNGMVQQVIAKHGDSADGKQGKQSNTLKNRNALAQNPKTPAQELDASITPIVFPNGLPKSSEETVASQLLTSVHRSSRPKSLVSNVPDDMSQRCSTQYSSVEKLPTKHDQHSEVFSKKKKLQSFAKLSQAALAAAILQKAAAESKARKNCFPDETTQYEKCQKTPSTNSRDKENPFESLV